MENERVRYTVREVVSEAPGVASLSLVDERGAVPEFLPGQFINIYFPETNTPEGKAYSISSSPEEKTFSITVRALGEFSNRLCDMRPGNTVEASLPYGFFRPERDESPVVMLAAGIGITPFRSIIRHAAFHTPHRRLSLFHSVRSSKDTVFRKEFESLAPSLPNFSLSYFITREDVSEISNVVPRRIAPDDILAKTPDVSSAEFLLCGSISFTRDMWRSLRHAGIPEDAMYTEAFFSH